MDETKQLVVVVEDDDSMRQALQRFLLASGYRARAFPNAEALLAADGAGGADCLVLDVHLPGVSGTDLYLQLGGSRPPAVFITSHDVPDTWSRVARLRIGEVLLKPFLSHQLMTAIDNAIHSHSKPP